MRKLLLLLATLMILCFIPLKALAEGETQTAETSPSPTVTTPVQEETPLPHQTESSAVSITIDNKNVYEGMVKAYQDGYVPQVKRGIVTVVLPLVADGAIKGNAITATPGMGDPASSPFVFKNYQKTVQLKDNAVNGGHALVSSYLVRFDLPLKSGRVNGVYPVTINIQAQAMDGSTIQLSFTSYVTITDGKDPNAAPPTPKPEVPVSQPKIIISGYSLTPSPVVAGQDFTVRITFRNTSEAKSVQNMAMTASCDSPDFSLQNDSNTIFIGSLGNGQSTDIELKYKTGLKTPAQRYSITLAIEYDNAEAETLSSTGTVPIPISQPLRVQMEAPKLPEQVNAGDTLPLSFQVMNLGRNMVYNVRCELSAPGLIPTGTAFIGNMEAGSAKAGEMDVFVGTKDMSEGHEKDEKYGHTNGTITLIYEDETGKEYTVKTEISTTINEPVISPATAEPKKEPEKAGQWWVSLLIGGAIVAGLAMYLIYRSRRQVKRHEDT